MRRGASLPAVLVGGVATRRGVTAVTVAAVVVLGAVGVRVVVATIPASCNLFDTSLLPNNGSAYLLL